MINAREEQSGWHEGLTVHEFLETLGAITDPVVVRVNGKVVRQSLWKTILIPDRAEVDIWPLLVGG